MLFGFCNGSASWALLGWLHLFTWGRKRCWRDSECARLEQLAQTPWVGPCFWSPAGVRPPLLPAPMLPRCLLLPLILQPVPPAAGKQPQMGTHMTPTSCSALQWHPGRPRSRLPTDQGPALFSALQC